MYATLFSAQQHEEKKIGNTLWTPIGWNGLFVVITQAIIYTLHKKSSSWKLENRSTLHLWSKLRRKKHIPVFVSSLMYYFERCVSLVFAFIFFSLFSLMCSIFSVCFMSSHHISHDTHGLLFYSCVLLLNCKFSLEFWTNFRIRDILKSSNSL